MSANARVAEVLYEIGEILTIKEDRFRSRAFNMAAQRITALTDDVRNVHGRGELEGIPGVGKSIAAIIVEVLESGTSVALEELREFSRLITEDVYSVLGAENVVARYRSHGSSAPAEVARQLQRWKSALEPG